MDRFIGVDVSKKQLDVAMRPEGEAKRFANDEAGITALLDFISKEPVKLLVVEATGGYEMLLVGHLLGKKIAVAVANPRQVRDFAKATGRLAKTDAIDAKVLAHFAEAIRPEPRPMPDEETQELHGLLTRRRQLIEMKVAEQNRLSLARGASRRDIQTHINFLASRLKRTDKDIGSIVKDSPVWRARDELLQSVPSVGPTTSAMLIADLPELGRLTRQQIATLVGVAPLNRDSGTIHGKRTTWGGRAHVRATLYMAALVGTRFNPDLKRFYERLLLAGKPKKLAIIACARKLLCILNAICRDNRAWSPNALTA